MNTKKIIIIVLSVLLLACIGLGCFLLIRNEQKPSDTDTVRQLLTAINRNVNEYSRKSYEISFRQVYDFAYQDRSDREDVDFSISYSGEGAVSMSYKHDGKTENRPKISDLLAADQGYLTGKQTERIKYYNNEVRRIEGEEISRTDDHELGLEHTFAIRIDSEDFYAVSEDRYVDYKDESNGMTDSFSGRIGKSVLTDSVSDETMTNVFSQLLFMDAWAYIEQIRKLSDDYLTSLDFSDDEEINRFIEKNAIRIVEEGNAVYIYFSLHAREVLSAMLMQPDGNISDVAGTVKFDRKSGEILYFKYDLSEYLRSVLDVMGADKQQYHAAVEEFVVEGEFFNKPLEDISPDTECKAYTEEDKDEFFRQFREHFIPFYAEEG